MSPGCFQVALVYLLQRRKDYGEEERPINRALRIATGYSQAIGESSNAEAYFPILASTIFPIYRTFA